MTFFSRPNLSDIEFKQTDDSVLSLSGLTKIKNVSGLTLSNGQGDDVLINISGASSGTSENHVLTYTNGEITLKPSSSSGGTTDFNTDRITTRSGIPEVCVGGDCTINNFLEEYFFPAVGPTSSLSIATGGDNREFGDTSVGNLSYSATRETHEICLIEIDDDADGTYNNIIVSTPISVSCSGTIPYTYPFNCANVTGSTSTSVSFGVNVETVCGESDSSSTSITWKNKKFTFKSSTLYTDDSIETLLTSGELSTSKSKTLNNESFNNQFFYYVYPEIFGIPTFKVNGLQNNAWGSESNNTLYKFNYTNSQNYTTRYIVARSDNRITGTFNIEIS